jgi:hypothetical protein
MDNTCTLFCEGIERPGCDENGICICSDDEDPTILCEDFDSGEEFEDCICNDSPDEECEDSCEDCPWSNKE